MQQLACVVGRQSTQQPPLLIMDWSMARMSFDPVLVDDGAGVVVVAKGSDAAVGGLGRSGKRTERNV